MGIGVERVQAKIKADIARILQSGLKDPRLGAFVTVVSCKLTADYRHCKVYVSILADKESDERKTMRGLEDACGFIQRRVAKGLRTRVTPQLEFLQDKGAEQSVKIGSLLENIRREREERDGAPEDEEAAEAGADEASPAEADADEASPAEADEVD